MITITRGNNTRQAYSKYVEWNVDEVEQFDFVPLIIPANKLIRHYPTAPMVWDRSARRTVTSTKPITINVSNRVRKAYYDKQHVIGGSDSIITSNNRFYSSGDIGIDVIKKRIYPNYYTNRDTTPYEVTSKGPSNIRTNTTMEEVALQLTDDFQEYESPTHIIYDSNDTTRNSPRFNVTIASPIINFDGYINVSLVKIPVGYPNGRLMFGSEYTFDTTLLNSPESFAIHQDTSHRGDYIHSNDTTDGGYDHGIGNLGNTSLFRYIYDNTAPLDIKDIHKRISRYPMATRTLDICPIYGSLTNRVPPVISRCMHNMYYKDNALLTALGMDKKSIRSLMLSTSERLPIQPDYSLIYRNDTSTDYVVVRLDAIDRAKRIYIPKADSDIYNPTNSEINTILLREIDIPYIKKLVNYRLGFKILKLNEVVRGSTLRPIGYNTYSRIYIHRSRYGGDFYGESDPNTNIPGVSDTSMKCGYGVKQCYNVAKDSIIMQLLTMIYIPDNRRFGMMD